MAKTPKPKPVAIYMRVWLSIKRNPVKSATAVLGLLAAYPTGMAGARLLSDQIEPSWVAQRGWVRESIEEKLKPFVVVQADDRRILRDLQIDGANRSLRDEKNSQAQWLVKRKETNDPLTLELIDRQLSLSKDSIDALQDQVKTLNELKAKGR